MAGWIQMPLGMEVE